MTEIAVTIAICTWNRAESLRHTLASLRDMDRTRNIAWEVVIVDNNCTDHTQQVIADFAQTLPIRSVEEKRQGISHARNSAVAAARGTHIVWTDDDVTVDRQWLASYADAFYEWPSAAVFGGPIFPQFAGEAPRWIKRAIEEDVIRDIYAFRDFGPEAVLLGHSNRIPYGANFAVRTEEQRRFPYNPLFGAVRDNQVRGEEVDVVRKILASGSEGRWVPNAIVHHCIPKDRQTTAYLRDYYIGHGRFVARNRPPRDVRLFLGAPRWLWIALATSEASFVFKRVFYPPRTWCKALAKASTRRGMILEYRILNRTETLHPSTPQEAKSNRRVDA